MIKMEGKEVQSTKFKKTRKKYNIYYLDLDQIKKIIASAKSLRDRIVLKLLSRTGMRRFELCSLRIQDVDFDGKKIFIAKGKGNVPRSVPIDEDTLQDIKFYMGSRQHGKLIQSNNKKIDGIDESRINMIVRKTAERAGIKHPDPTKKHLNPHIFRHSFIRNLIRLGVPPNYLQQLAGHSDIRTTLQMYGIPSFKDTQDKYNEVIKNFY